MSQIKKIYSIIIIVTMIVTFSPIDSIGQGRANLSNAYDANYFKNTILKDSVTLEAIGAGNCNSILEFCTFPVLGATSSTKAKVDIKAIYKPASGLDPSPVSASISDTCLYVPVKKSIDCQFQYLVDPSDYGTKAEIILIYQDGKLPEGPLTVRSMGAIMDIIDPKGFSHGFTKSFLDPVSKLTQTQERTTVLGKKVKLNLTLDSKDTRYTSLDKVRITMKSKTGNAEIKVDTKIIPNFSNGIAFPSNAYAEVTPTEEGMYRISACKIIGSSCEDIVTDPQSLRQIQVFKTNPKLLPLNQDLLPKENNDRANVVLTCTQDHFNNSIDDCKNKYNKMFNFNGKPLQFDRLGEETNDASKTEILGYGLFGIDPFRSFKSKFNFYYINELINIDSGNFLEYFVDVENFKLVDNKSLITLLSNSPNSIFPNAFAVNPRFNNNPRKNSFKLITMNPTFPLRNGMFTLAHEFNHVFSDLNDEYLSTINQYTSNCAKDQQQAETLWGDKIGQVSPFVNEWIAEYNKYPRIKENYAKARNISFSNTDFIKTGYFNNGCEFIPDVVDPKDPNKFVPALQTSIRPTSNSLMRGGSDGVDPLGSVNESLVMNVLNLYTGNPITNCNNGRVFPDCSQLDTTKSTPVCPSIIKSFKPEPSEYDTTTGYCKNKTTSTDYGGFINFGSFPKAIIDECKRITPIDRVKDCTGTINVDVFGARVTVPYLKQAKLVEIKAAQKGTCLKTNKQLPGLGLYYTSACFEEIKNSKGVIEKTVYGVFNTYLVNKCLNNGLGNMCMLGKLPIATFLDLLDRQADKDTLAKLGIKQ
jgi:hypothetical protein